MFGYGYMSDPEVFKDSVFKQAIEMIRKGTVEQVTGDLATLVRANKVAVGAWVVFSGLG
tara:strand:- start:4433 stop:4609 length:177 start_codon:yes stop_codon:yes gene_type:complete